MLKMTLEVFMDEADKMGMEIAKAGLEKAKDFIGKLITPAIEEAGGIIQDTVKSWRVKNQVNIALKAQKYFERKGLDPKKVPLKILVPLLENGSLEDDENMQDKWAALLASAAHPEMGDYITPNYPAILKELSPKEVLILDTIYEEVKDIEWKSSKYGKEFHKYLLLEQFGIDSYQFDIIANNLFRLGLILEPRGEQNITPGDGQYDMIHISPLGLHFIGVCRFEG
jgi:hypothetical protein